MGFIETMEQAIPAAPGKEAGWDELSRLLSGTGFSLLVETPQDPAYHGEGNVLVHTRAVCRELASDPGFFRLDARRRTELYLAAVLHDVGKAWTTRLENGTLICPHHGPSGSRRVREFLWRDCGLCGTPEGMAIRETVCALIRHHMLPLHLISREDAERMARTVAAAGEHAPGFNWERLCMLSRADARGRIAEDVPDMLARVEMARMLAEEAGCLTGPYPFADEYTKHAWLSGRNVPPDQALFDGTWGEVILLSGLPGTGKDTWILKNHPGLPVVSPDRIRKEQGIGPEENQGRVVQAAKERARTFLRKKEPFVWNATNLTREMRQPLVRLAEQYGARVRIVYLETEWETRLERNAGRADAVPEGTIGRMLRITEPPMPEEAQAVEWVCV